MAWVEVECPNEDCKGREVCHLTTCRCGGKGRVPGDDPHTFEDCPEEADITPHRWMAEHRNATHSHPSEWGPSIDCGYCGTEGEVAE